MKSITLIFNIVLFGFLCLSLLVDGMPEDNVYKFLTVWSLFTLAISFVVISSNRIGYGWLRFGIKVFKKKGKKKKEFLSSEIRILRITTIAVNIVFFGLICWAFIEQFPHPDESGIIAFTILMFITPILNLLVLYQTPAGKVSETDL